MGILRRFWSGADGRKANVAIIFALALIPIMGATGAAVDYSLANSNRASIQKSLDATALALAKLMPLNQTQLDTQGWQIFQAALGNIKVTIAASDLKITTPTVGKLVLNVSGQYQTSITGVIGINNFPVGAHAEVTWGMKKLELALALDNTGSMQSNNKMTELKKAAKSLLTTLKNSAKTNGDVKVSIIPFNTVVNTGWNTSNAMVKKGDWDEKEGSCSNNNYTTKTSCQNANRTWTGVTYNNTNFKGCVEDRDKDTNLNYDVLDTTPTNVNATKFPARRCPGGLTTYLPLTYNWTDLNDKVDDMDSDGMTNVTIGLVWAWHSLTPNQPLTEAVAANSELSKIIILMTDGDNTENRWSSNENTINLRTAAACTNIKAGGIQIYTIRVIDGNATLLRDCASDPSMYYDVQNASQLTSVFNAIGGQLAKLHLSQ